MRRDDDDRYEEEEEEDDEIFSDFYSYCAERVSSLSLRRRKEEDEEWHDDDEEDEEDATTTTTTTIKTIRAVLEDVTRLVIFFDEEEEKEAKSSRCYPSLEKKRVDAYRDARRRREQKRNERGEDAKTAVTASLSTLVFAGVEELLAVIAEKTIRDEKKGEEMDISKTSMREAWVTRLPKEHFVNAMLNADASDSRAKKTNKAMADMFKECLAIECNGSDESTFSTSFFETGGFVQDREEDDAVGNSKTKAQKYFRDLERASEEMRTLLNACERADLILKKRLYERLVLEEHQKEKEREIGAVELFARGCCALPHRKRIGDEENDMDDKKSRSRRIVLASTCLQILSRRGYAEKCANAIVFVHFKKKEEQEGRGGEKLLDRKDDDLARVIDSISDTRACCKIIESVVADVFGRKIYTNASRDCECVLRQMLKVRFWKCETTRYFMGEDLLLRKGCPRNVLPSLLRLLIVNPLPTVYLSDEEEKDEMGALVPANVSVGEFKHATIVSACELWASKEFVVGSSSKAKGHVAAVINTILILSQSSGNSWEKFINGIEGEEFNDGAKMTSYIVDGISSRLESSSAQSRAHASRIAKQFSLAMNPENPTVLDLNAPVDGDTDLLDPDEGQNDDDDDGYKSVNEAEWESNVSAALGEYDTSNVLPSSFYESENVEDDSTKSKVPSIDIEDVGEQDEEDDTEEDDEEFQAYDIDSDDDDELTQKQTNAKSLKRHLKQLPKPRTLREALNALRRVKPSQHTADADLADAQEGAVYALAEMFETVPDELFSVADQFSIALLHANPPTPSAKTLEISRMHGLTRLFENAPEESIPTAIGHAFDGTSCDSSHKLEVLSCISQAAKTLSAVPPPSECASLAGREGENTAVPATSGKTRVFAPKALENRNKGIGRNGHRTRSALIGPTIVAPLLVSLSSQLEKMADLSSSIGSEAIVLSSMLDCIGECCGRTQNAVNAFNTAIATLATLTKHDAFLLKHCDPSVRSSALVACARALTVVPDILAKEELMLSLQGEENGVHEVDIDKSERPETKTSKLFAAIEKITSVAKIESVRGVDEQCRSAGVFAFAATRDVVRRATENTLLDVQNADPEKQQQNLPAARDFVLPKAESKRFQRDASQVVAKAMEKLRVNAPTVNDVKKRENVRFG
jgi:hypothetical protein